MSRPLRGAYIARLDLTEPHLAGVAAKIRGQIAALETLPARVKLIHPSKGSILIEGEPWKIFGSGTFARRWTHYFRFYHSIATRSEPLDFVYVRDQGCSPLFLWMLRRLRRTNPKIIVLLELPSYPFYSGPMSLRERVFALIDCATRGRLHHYVDRIVTFSRERRIFGIETIMTDNGVDVERMNVLTPPPLSDSLQLLGLANLSFWHGYDRLIAGLAEYRSRGGQQRVCFDIVGSGSELDRLKTMTEALELQNCVKFWGPQRGAALEEIVRRAHIGISSIGMHRLSVDTSNIKSREFCARGLPFAHAYDDRDFDSTLPFVLRLPADENPIDIEQLISFFETLRIEHPGYVSLMRDHAEQYLTWDAKMAPAIDYLRAHGSPHA